MERMFLYQMKLFNQKKEEITIGKRKTKVKRKTKPETKIRMKVKLSEF